MVIPPGGQHREIQPFQRLGRVRTEHLLAEHLQAMQGTLSRGDVQSSLRMPRHFDNMGLCLLYTSPSPRD
eukprot:4717186-Alexandrium_andersonii.AAC.1